MRRYGLRRGARRGRTAAGTRRGDSPAPDVPPWSPYPFLADALAALSREGVRFAWLRCLEAGAEAGTPAFREVDLIAGAARLRHLARVLARRGFVELPGWGHAPHHFFVGYDARRGAWWKLDVITDLRYGHPFRVLRAGEVGELLDRVDGTGRLAPDDELLTLLLRCLLNRADFAPGTRARISVLHRAVSLDPGLTARAARETGRWLAPALDWGTLSPALEREDWEGLLRLRRRVARRLFLREPLGVVWRRTATRVARRMRPLLLLLRGRGAALVILGDDGSETAALIRGLAAEPFIRATVAGTAPPVPLPPAGLDAARLLAGQWRRSAGARIRQLRGETVVYDRNPADPDPAGRGPGLRAGILARLLAVGAPRPDRVFVLGARSGTPRRGGRELPGARVVDTSAGREAVKRAVVAALWSGVPDRAGRRA